MLVLIAGEQVGRCCTPSPPSGEMPRRSSTSWTDSDGGVFHVLLLFSFADLRSYLLSPPMQDTISVYGRINLGGIVSSCCLLLLLLHVFPAMMMCCCSGAGERGTDAGVSTRYSCARCAAGGARCGWLGLGKPREPAGRTR